MMKGPVELIEDSSQSNDMNSDNSANEFSEYMWMGEELEEFDRQVEEQFWQEQFWETYLDELMEGDNVDDKMELLQMMDMLSFQDPQSNSAAVENGNAATPANHHQQSTASASISNSSTTLTARSSTLNPNAPEFIPRNVSPINAADR